MSNPYLKASRNIWEALKQPTAKIEADGDSSVKPLELLPVDEFLTGMTQRQNAPRITCEPKHLKNQL